MNLHSIHKRRIQFSRQRWRDGEGRYLKGATDMKTPDLVRAKGKKVSITQTHTMGVIS